MSILNLIISITFVTISIKCDQTPEIKLATTVFNPNPNQDFGNCNCDLTVGFCDANCCCDPQCTSADLVAFNCPTTNTPTNDRKWCVPNSMLFRQNSPYVIESLGELLCIDVNNSFSMNYYQTPILDGMPLKEVYVKQLVDIYNPPTLSANTAIFTAELNQNANQFSTSDFVWSLTSSNYFAYLTLPTQVGQNCRDGPPNFYLKEKNSNCIRSTKEMQNECANPGTTSLGSSYFIDNFKLIKSPNSLVNCLKQATNPSNPFSYFSNCDEKFLTSVKARFCTFGDAQPISCPTDFKVKLDSGKCVNLVKSVTYILKYLNPGGITSVYVDFEFFDAASPITLDNIKQTFKIVFVPDSVSLTNYNFVVKLSGNPGYLIGEPIQAGTYSASSGSINIVADRNKRFTIFSSGTNGVCSNDDSTRVPIRFGYNMVTQCRYTETPTSSQLSSTYCTNLQNKIDNIILGYSLDSRANAYAPFANSETSNWVSILNTQPTQQPTLSLSGHDGVCKLMRTSVSVQIAYALVGNINNPQAKIQYVSYDWSDLTNVNFRCSNQYCTNKNQLSLSITARVTFLDVSQTPIYTESRVPRPRAILPGDFFYPFGSSNSISLRSNLFTNLLIVLLIIVF